MDENLEHKLRLIFAEQAAQRFIIDYLLKHLWLELTRKQRLKLAEALLDASEQTEHLSGLAKNDDFAAERLSDMTVRMQESIDQYVGRALKATAEVEDATAARHAGGD